MTYAATALLLTIGIAMPTRAQDATYVQAGYDTDGQSVDTIAVFFEPLAHYGRWLDGRYGRCWSPDVRRDWRPYTIGHWEEGAYGPTWRSDEPFGWAVFHFGRWAFDPPIGWVWLPDTVWGPGWVAWRDGDDVAGWAPLPPQVNALVAADYSFNDWGYDQWYQPGWVYVPRGYLFARSLRGVTLPYGRNRDAWDHSRGVTRYDRLNGQVVNRSFGGDRRGGHADVRRVQPLRAPVPGSRDEGGFIPLPHGYGDGAVPGAVPRGVDRRVVPPGTLAIRPPPPARTAMPHPVPSRPVPPARDSRPR